MYPEIHKKKKIFSLRATELGVMKNSFLENDVCVTIVSLIGRNIYIYIKAFIVDAAKICMYP
jgi:hypothetical protein